MRNLSVLTGRLDRHAAYVAIGINIEQSALIKVPGLSNLGGPQYDMQDIGVLKIVDLYGANLRSKNALCTVSLSARSITRKYLPSISSISAQRRIHSSY
jgi:hypothetical protein